MTRQFGALPGLGRTAAWLPLCLRLHCLPCPRPARSTGGDVTLPVARACTSAHGGGGRRRAGSNSRSGIHGFHPVRRYCGSSSSSRAAAASFSSRRRSSASHSTSTGARHSHANGLPPRGPPRHHLVLVHLACVSRPPTPVGAIAVLLAAPSGPLSQVAEIRRRASRSSRGCPRWARSRRAETRR